MEGSDLSSDTAVTKLERAPGWYTADLPPAWNYLTPSGGVLMTVALRAMQLEVGTDMRPTSATSLFCSPVPHGPLEIRVEVLRRGNVATQVRAALSSTTLPGPGLEVSATFTRDRKGPDVYGRDFPADVKAIEDGEPFMGEKGPVFFRNFETRIALGHRWWKKGWEAGEARFARWHRYLVPQQRDDGSLDPLSLPPIADTMPPALLMKLGPDQSKVVCPSLDLTLHFLDASPSAWVLTHCTCRRARGGYATADMEIWGEDRRLLAFGTQMMMISRWPL